MLLAAVFAFAGLHTPTKVVVEKVAVASSNYSTPASQVQLYMAASAVGALAYCEQVFEYKIPRHVDEVAFGRLAAVFHTDPSLAEMATTAQHLLMLSARDGIWLQIVLDGDKPTPDRVDHMETRANCAAPQEFIEVLMQKGGILDLKGPLDQRDTEASLSTPDIQAAK